MCEIQTQINKSKYKAFIIFIWLDSKLVLKNKNDEKILQDLTKTKMGKENSNKIKINHEQNIDYLKPRSNTFDTKKYQIKINIGKINFFGNNTIQRYIEGNESRNEDRKNLFLNTNKFPKIITRISLSNFNKKNNINIESEMNNDVWNSLETL